MLPPASMWEWYQAGGRRAAAGYAYVEGLAQYSDLRLFTVATTEELK